MYWYDILYIHIHCPYICLQLLLIVILSGSVGHRGEPTNSCVWLKLCHLQCSREVSGSASVCPFSSWIPALGCLISLGLTQTCSLCSLHTLSARWFVRIHGIWAHSVCFGKWSIAASQDAKMLIGSSSRMSVCHPLLPPYAVAQMLVHMFQLVTLCVCAHCLLFMYVFLLFIEEYNTSIQEKLPLIIGSAAAGLVFLIAVVVIIIVCNRWVSLVPVLLKWIICTSWQSGLLLISCAFVQWGSMKSVCFHNHNWDTLTFV